MNLDNISISSATKSISPFLTLVERLYFVILGSSSVVLLLYIFYQLIQIFISGFHPRGAIAYFYYGIHTASYLLFLSLGGVFLLRVLIYIRNYLLFPWDLVTPPFERNIDIDSKGPDRDVIMKSTQYGCGFLLSGFIIAYLFPIFAFVPFRHGVIDLTRIGSHSFPFSIPEFLIQLPIIGDIGIIFGFISSPNQMGYLLLSIPLILLIIGLENIAFLFQFRNYILKEKANEIPKYIIHFLKWMPYVGILSLLLIFWQFWPINFKGLFLAPLVIEGIFDLAIII